MVKLDLNKTTEKNVWTSSNLFPFTRQRYQQIQNLFPKVQINDNGLCVLFSFVFASDKTVATTVEQVYV